MRKLKEYTYNECRACEFCDTDLEHKTCIDTFEAWAKMEAI